MFLVAVPPFLVLIAFFGALIFAVMGRQVSEGIVSWLKDAGRVAAFIAGPVGIVSVKLTRWITHNVGAAFADLERLAVAWFSGLYQWAELVISDALAWPVYLYQFQNWLLFTYLPKLLQSIPHAIGGTVTRIVKQVRVVERTVVKLPKLTKAQAKALIAAAVATYVHPYLSSLRWLRAHFHALTAVLPRALPIPQFPAFPNLWKRIRALERKIGVPVALGVVAAALARLGLGWIRCNKVRRVGKSVCGIDDSLLDQLLLGATAIFSVVSVVEFATELRAIEDEAVSIMGRLVREWPA